MSDTAFDTLSTARELKASGLGAEQADAIVEVVSQSTSQFVTVERFDAGIAMLRGRIDSVRAVLSDRIDAVETRLSDRIDAVETRLSDRIDAVETGLSDRIDAVQTGLSTRIDAVQTGLSARIDSVRAELRAEIWRSILIAVGILIAANALMMTVLGIFLGAVLTNSAPP